MSLGTAEDGFGNLAEKTQNATQKTGHETTHRRTGVELHQESSEWGLIEAQKESTGEK